MATVRTSSARPVAKLAFEFLVLTAAGRLNDFGQYWDSEDGRNATDVAGGPEESWLYPAYAGKALVDLELGIPFGEALTLVVGGENVSNTYPDVNQYGADTVGNQYGQFSPFSFNGT